MGKIKELMDYIFPEMAKNEKKTQLLDKPVLINFKSWEGGYCKLLGEAITVGELKKLLNKYDDKTSFGFRNQPMQQLYELKYGENIFVVFQ